MIRSCNRTRALPVLILVTVLIALQSMAQAHTYEHEAGILNHQVCATCVAHNNFSSACANAVFAPNYSSLDLIDLDADFSEFRSVHELRVRQRGPPLSH